MLALLHGLNHRYTASSQLGAATAATAGEAGGMQPAAGALPVAGRTNKVVGAQERRVGVMSEASAAEQVRQICRLDMPVSVEAPAGT
jgi:hypothetical protein